MKSKKMTIGPIRLRTCSNIRIFLVASAHGEAHVWKRSRGNAGQPTITAARKGPKRATSLAECVRRAAFGTVDGSVVGYDISQQSVGLVVDPGCEVKCVPIETESTGPEPEPPHPRDRQRSAAVTKLT
jgi:hypothetical protein